MHYACSMYLLAVPPGTNSSIVMSDGDSAEWTEERSKLNLKDVCQAPLKLSSLQKHLHHKHRREVERKRKGSYTAELNSKWESGGHIQLLDRNHSLLSLQRKPSLTEAEKTDPFHPVWTFTFWSMVWSKCQLKWTVTDSNLFHQDFKQQQLNGLYCSFHCTFTNLLCCLLRGCCF